MQNRLVEASYQFSSYFIRFSYISNGVIRLQMGAVVEQMHSVDIAIMCSCKV